MTTAPQWKTLAREILIVRNRAELRFTSNTGDDELHAGTDANVARDRFVAGFRSTSDAWQGFERLRTRYMAADLSLVDALRDAEEAERQFAFNLEGGEELAEQKRADVARLRANMATLRKAIVEAYDLARAEFAKQLSEHSAWEIESAHGAMLEVVDRIDLAISPLLNELRQKRSQWQAAMASSQATSIEQALGSRPTFAHANEPASVPVINKMIPTIKTLTEKAHGYAEAK